MLLKIPELETMRDRFPRVFEDCLMFIRTGLIRVLFKKRYLLTSALQQIQKPSLQTMRIISYTVVESIKTTKRTITHLLRKNLWGPVNCDRIVVTYLYFITNNDSEQL